MKKIILVTLTSILCILEISGQQVSFQIQAGLSSAIRKIVPIEKDRVLCVVTSDGNLVLWDLSRNKIGNRLNLDA